MLFTFPWLRYRKMYAYSWAYFFISLPVILLFTALGAFYADTCAADLSGTTPFLNKLPFILLAANVLLPLGANCLYFRSVTKRIESFENEQSDQFEIGEKLREKGSTASYAGSIGLILGLMVIVVLSPGMGGNYSTRAKIAEVILAGSSYRTATTEFFGQYRRLPKTIDDIGGFSGPTGKVRRVALDKDGTIRVTAGFLPAEGRSILLTPSVRDEKLSSL